MLDENYQKTEKRWAANNRLYLKSYSSLTILNGYLEQLKIPKNEVVGCLFTSIVGLFALGKYHLDDIDLFTTNRYFQDSLGIKLLPSAKTLKNEIGKYAEDLVSFAGKLNLALECQFERSGLNKPAHADYKKNEMRDPYIADFLAEAASDHHFDALSSIHAFTANCLRLIAADGVTGELFSSASLFSIEIQAKLAKDGYAVIPSVLSSDEVDNLRTLVLKIAEAERLAGVAYIYGGSNTCQRIYNLLNKHQLFRDLVQRPLILEIMEHMFARDTLHDKYVLSSWHTNIIGGGGESSILHVDAAVPEPLPPWIIRSNINYMLDDFTEENGATLCLPGSHRFLRKPKKEDQTRSGLVPMLAPKGSLAIWDGHLWHKSGENRTKRDRIALLGCFAASHLREMALEENHLQVIQSETVENMSPTLKRLIGVGYGIKKGALQDHSDL